MSHFHPSSVLCLLLLLHHSSDLFHHIGITVQLESLPTLSLRRLLSSSIMPISVESRMERKVKCNGFKINLTPIGVIFLCQNMHDELFKLQDLQYKDFHAKPLKSDEHSLFLTHLPHHYYDENQLHAFMISETKDFPEVNRQANIFLPYVNN